MFTKTRLKLRTTNESIQAAFGLLVVTLQNLTLAIADNSATVAANTAENSLLRSKLDTINEHTHYLARAKKNELSRQGHQVV